MAHKFEIVYLDPCSLIPYEKNAKKHNEQQISDLAAAIKKRGFDQPITVDKDMVIITGHGRTEASIFAGLAKVPVIIRDDLSKAEVDAKRLEDNRLASTDYDALLLQEELKRLVDEDVAVYGFSERELNVLVEDMTASVATTDFVSDLAVETERQRDEHEEITREVAKEDVRLVDIMGFKTLPASAAIQVGDLLAHMEEVTGKESMDAFVAFAEKVSQEMYGADQ
ncbi:ParB/Srx family N-terminal domain-containing protein [Xenorhabdus bovienii]|uniref:ParB/Srx family N-terminal domain-containing protein n=1 Tax=Xenorhabdus bovienii TaxID=40576 RepID=UPI0023B25060|nr:ParB/Srx family N-terminal domain-containing protein [Xenorhabdus bovienii]MDE9494506.1 ParB/Srx family N-terminal domain-containing protein [Xenorhabdus bovienii]MDE9502903.1 ParB/Srx family N-terminal domain-containing protein [Xenorhabdus bovienii]MDE9526553.1 ParB/Srx family N-terminal domain-containing protein [Xenorhabdus bovienii]